MGIFPQGKPLASAAGRRYKIKLTTEDGRVLYWRKRGEIHLLEEDVADIFVARFQPELFQVRSDGTLTPPVPGETILVAKVEKELA